MRGRIESQLHLSPDSVATTTTPPGRLPCGDSDLSANAQMALLHRRVMGLPDKPPRFHDSYSDPTPRLRVEPLAAPENPILIRAAADITEIAMKFVPDELVTRGIPFPPSEEYDVVFFIIGYHQEHGVWAPRLLTFDGAQFETCSTEPTGEGDQQKWTLGTRASATPEIIVRHAGDVFCTLSMLLKNRKKWLDDTHQFRGAEKVRQALARNREVEEKLGIISKNALGALIPT